MALFATANSKRRFDADDFLPRARDDEPKSGEEILAKFDALFGNRIVQANE